MSTHRIFILSIFTLIFTITLTAQNTPLQVYVHDNYTDHPLESVLVSVLLNGVVIDSAYTDVNGIATLSGVTSVREPVGLPTSITLSHNYPNPFRDDTKVEIGIPEAQTITATVYNILGQRVASEQLPVAGGYYTLNLSLGHLPTGVYFLRIDGRESQAIKLLKMGRGVHPSGPVFSISGSRFPGGATIGKSSGDEYTVRAVKDRYDVYETVLEQPLTSGVAVPLARNNIVEFVVVDGDNNPVTKQLEIKMHDYQTTITTPHTLTLKSGVYRALGEVEEGISLERTVEIPSVDTTVVLSFEESGVKLEGAPDAPAIDATNNLYIPIVYPEDAISVDPDLQNNRRVLRTEIEVLLDPDVTVAEVNDFLDKYNAQIVSMLEGNTIFIIRVPDPGDVASLNQLIADIENEDIVFFALKSIIVRDPEPVYDPTSPNDLQKIPDHIHNLVYDRIDHHLAIRAHAAWNLRGAITTMVDIRPWIVIADLFGDGAPGTGYNASFRHTDFATGEVDLHGYHVLGIISGMYDRVGSLTDEQNHVVGMFPEWLRVRAVDLKQADANTWPRRYNLMIKRMNDIILYQPTARIIVNTSLGDTELLMENARSWIIKVRGIINLRTVGADLENRFIHFTAAGNKIPGQDIPNLAIEDSPFAYAAFGDVTLLGLSIPNLTNIFAVENRVNTLHDAQQSQRPVPGCASVGSCMGGNLSAIGNRVWSFGDCLFWDEDRCIVHRSDPHTTFASGTSMATPQAAGVAAFVWAVNPDLSVSEVMDIIRITAVPDTTTSTPGFNCNTVQPQPVVDAYAAVLLAGGSDARRALLDVNGNGTFDHNDIEEFLEVYLDTLIAGTLDYSRFDLNGDGFTGGNRKDRFDLTMDGEYSVVEQNIEGMLIPFDENELTDMEILCYYAYSDLYQGNADRRRELLDGLCPITDIDGNIYRVVVIGDQWWMAENLKTTRYHNGDPIPHLYNNRDWENTTEGAYSIYDHNHLNAAGLNSDEEVVDAYGKLYNWYAVNDPRGLCPEGWRVPSDEDWMQLEMYLGMSIEDADSMWIIRGTDEGGKLKSTRTWPSPHPHWFSPNEGATDEYGWSGLPGGWRDFMGNYGNLVFLGGFWTTTLTQIHHEIFALIRQLDSDISCIGRMRYIKTNGFSVRCIRDD